MRRRAEGATETTEEGAEGGWWMAGGKPGGRTRRHALGVSLKLEAVVQDQAELAVGDGGGVPASKPMRANRFAGFRPHSLGGDGGGVPAAARMRTLRFRPHPGSVAVGVYPDWKCTSSPFVGMYRALAVTSRRGTTLSSNSSNATCRNNKGGTAARRATARPVVRFGVF